LWVLRTVCSETALFFLMDHSTHSIQEDVECKGQERGVICVSNIYFEMFILLLLQYSQKEDKYEEEIKILTDKLKEVSWGDYV